MKACLPYPWLRLLVLSLVLVAGTAVHAAERRQIWEKRDQFVAVEKQDNIGNAGMVANDQPVQLPAEELRRTLAPLEVGLKGSEQPVALFTEGELEILGDAVGKGLALAGPDEDVTFAVIGLHQSSLGFFKQPMVTTGRTFFRQGKLNLILGMVHEPVSDYDDRRLKPFLPGSRSRSTPPDWRIVAKSGEASQVSAERPDWLTLSLVKAEQVMPAVQEIGARNGKAEPQPAQSLPAGQRPSGKSIAERLRILNELLDNKLITEDEYRAKRREILNEL